MPRTASSLEEFAVSDAEVCAVNIGPKQRRVRAISGVVGLAIAAGLAVFLARADVGAAWRAAAIFVPVYGGLLGLLQARAKT
ncbi:MAG: hypothetical protein AAF721_25560 [Myxococcota bacterium]